MTMKSDCVEGVAKEDCVGSAGFSVDADGTYRIGPNDQGKTYTGKVTADEVKQLEELAGLQLGEGNVMQPIAPLTSAAEHSRDLAESGSTDSISLKQKNSAAKQVLRTEPAKLFFPSAATEQEKIDLDAKRYQDLYIAFRTLANQYYLTPFPNPCVDAGQDFAKLFAPLQSCDADADCSYVDANFGLIGSEGGWVESDNCSYIPLMVTGNAKALNAEASAKLNAARDKAQEACTATPIRNNCSYAGFDAGQRGAAVCVNHACQVRPEAPVTTPAPEVPPHPVH